MTSFREAGAWGGEGDEGHCRVEGTKARARGLLISIFCGPGSH